MLTLKSNMSEGVMKVDVYFTVFIKLIPKTSRQIVFSLSQSLLSDFLLCRKMTKNSKKRRSLKMIRDKTKYHNENEEDAMCHT